MSLFGVDISGITTILIIFLMTVWQKTGERSVAAQEAGLIFMQWVCLAWGFYQLQLVLVMLLFPRS